MPPRDDDVGPRTGSDADEQRGPPRVGGDGGSDESGVLGRLEWLLRTDEPTVSFVREFVSSLLLVFLVGALLFGISGVWPPMVAVESGSMQPHMYPGDLVFVMDEGRLVPSHAVDGTGVVSYDVGEEHEYEKFGAAGDVIIFLPDGSDRTPIIHRAHFWVEEGEDWYDRADPRYVEGDSCESAEEEYCPAPHDGFITKGDHNSYYDQSQGISSPVKVDWIRGTAEVRIPLLGCVRLYTEGFENAPEPCLP